MSDDEISARKPIDPTSPPGNSPEEVRAQAAPPTREQPVYTRQKNVYRDERSSGAGYLGPEEGSERTRPRRPSLPRLLALTTFIPGTAQVLAGPSVLGRLARTVTFACWMLIAVCVLMSLIARGALLNVLLSPATSWMICAALIVLAIGWALLYLLSLGKSNFSRMQPGSKVVSAICTLVLIAVTSGTLLAGAYSLNATRKAFDGMFAQGTKVKPSNGRYNILLLGGDAGSDRTGRRPDSISVMSIDASTGDTVSFGIPRNLQNAPFPDTSPLKKVFPNGYNCGDQCIINSLYGTVNSDYKDLYPGAKDPGAEAMMDAASGVLGIEVQNYMLVDMGGFSDVVDAMGGVKVNSGGWVPVTSGEIPGTNPVRHYPPSEWMAPGNLTLDGYRAEWFARSREFTSDYNRIKRQQCIQSAMLSQMTPSLLFTRFGKISEAMSKLVETNIDRSQVGNFLDAGMKSRKQESRKLTIGAPDFPEMFSTYPNFDEAHRRVQQTLADTSSSKASASSMAPGAQTSNASAQTGSANVLLSATGGLSRSLPALLPMKDRTPEGKPITPEYLNELAKNWDDAQLAQLLSDNGNCTPGNQ